MDFEKAYTYLIQELDAIYNYLVEHCEDADPMDFDTYKNDLAAFGDVLTLIDESKLNDAGKNRLSDLVAFWVQVGKEFE